METLAPVMINFQNKCNLADKWRGLQEELLGDLSVLYVGMCTREKLKSWPGDLLTVGDAVNDLGGDTIRLSLLYRGQSMHILTLYLQG